MSGCFSISQELACQLYEQYLSWLTDCDHITGIPAITDKNIAGLKRSENTFDRRPAAVLVVSC